MNESSALVPTKQHLFQCCGNGSIKICTERMGVRRPPSLSPLWTHRFTSKLGKLVCSEDKRCWHCSHNLVYLTDIRHNASNRADERTLLAFFAVATGSQQRSVNASATPGSAQPMPPESTTTNRRTPNQPTTDQPTRISPRRISAQRINPLGSFLGSVTGLSQPCATLRLRSSTSFAIAALQRSHGLTTAGTYIVHHRL